MKVWGGVVDGEDGVVEKGGVGGKVVWWVGRAAGKGGVWWGQVRGGVEVVWWGM